MHRPMTMIRASVMACAALALAAPAMAQQDNTVVTAVNSDPGHFNPGITTGYDVPPDARSASRYWGLRAGLAIRVR